MIDIKKLEKKESNLNIANVLYSIGGLVLMIGLIILIMNNWFALGSAGRVLVTLGVAVVFYIPGVTLTFTRKDVNTLSQVFHIIAMILLPTGLGVLLAEMDLSNIFQYGRFLTIIFGITYGVAVITLALFRQRVYIVFSNLYGMALYVALLTTGPLVAILAPALLLVQNIISLRIKKSNLFAFLSVFFGLWTYVAVINWLISLAPSVFTDTFLEYVTFFTSIALGWFAYILSKSQYKKTSGFWYLVSSLGFFASAFLLSGFEPDQNVIWEILLAGLIFGAFFLSVYLRSKMVLFISAVALVSYIGKLTFQYFVERVGWPLSLIFIGLVLIGIGLLSVWVNNKYIKKENNNSPQPY